MTVYVDPLINHGVRIGRAGPEWCHLTADTDAELHAFAQRLGLRRSWFQHKPEAPWKDHYDLTKGKRAEAVRLGAIEIDIHEAYEQMKAKRRATA
ncbi:MAG: DUF4031 domain-containing protein [Dehalococcoidia bacterium]